MANDKTPNYHWDIPNPYGLQIVEMIKVVSTIGAIDSRFKSFEDAYQSHKHSFEQITNRPTTLSGYGITDAITTEQVRSEIKTSQDAQQSVIDQSIQSLSNGTADALALRVRVDAAQSFTLAQKSRARLNIDALGTVDKGAPNGVASLDAGGKIPSSQLPPVAITDTFVVNSQAAMLALVAERGDVVVRTDLNKTLILRVEPATVLANWQEMLTPTDAVTSVNGKTGSVTLAAVDIGALPAGGTAANSNQLGGMSVQEWQDFVNSKATGFEVEAIGYNGGQGLPFIKKNGVEEYRDLATKDYADQGRWPGVYKGQNDQEVNYPIGHRVLASQNNGAPNNNNIVQLRLRGGDGWRGYQIGGQGAVLSGVWQSRGQSPAPIVEGSNNKYYLFEAERVE